MAASLQRCVYTGNLRTARPGGEAAPRMARRRREHNREDAGGRRLALARVASWRGTQRGPSGHDLWRTCATAAADRAACACGWFRLGGVLRKTTGILLARPITKQTISRTKARRRAGAPIPRDARTNKAQAADGNQQCRRRSVVVDDTDNHHTGWRAHMHLGSSRRNRPKTDHSSRSRPNRPANHSSKA